MVDRGVVVVVAVADAGVGNAVPEATTCATACVASSARTFWVVLKNLAVLMVVLFVGALVPFRGAAGMATQARETRIDAETHSRSTRRLEYRCCCREDILFIGSVRFV